MGNFYLPLMVRLIKHSNILLRNIVYFLLKMTLLYRSSYTYLRRCHNLKNHVVELKTQRTEIIEGTSSRG